MVRRGVCLDRRVDWRVRLDRGRVHGRGGCVRLDRVHGRSGCVCLDQWFLGDDRVETIVRVGGVVDGPLGAVRVNQAVRSVHNVTVTALVLTFGVAGQLVVYIVSVRVRWIVIVVSVVRIGRHGVVDVRGWRVQGRRVRSRRVDGRSVDNCHQNWC